jgi:hypothetical protein
MNRKLLFVCIAIIFVLALLLTVAMQPAVMCGHIRVIGMSHLYQTMGVLVYQHTVPMYFLVQCVYGGPNGAIQ